MSTRYWVGGDGNWSQANYHWSDTSGGTPNASFLPTSVDDVLFDANSNTGTDPFTVCVDETAAANCQDFSTSSLDGAMTLLMNAVTSTLNVFGSLTLPASNFTWSAPLGGSLNFTATTTGKTVTTNGALIPTTSIFFNGAGGEWTLGSAFTGAGTVFNCSQGTFNTGNFNITCSNFNTTSNSLVRVINLGSSTLTLSGTTAFLIGSITTNLTFNAGTSTIICSAAAPTFAGGGQTFYNVEFSGGAGTKTVNGANTFNGQFLVSNAAATSVTFGASQTFTGGALIQATNPVIGGGGFAYTGLFEFASAAHGTKTLSSNQTFQNLKVTCPAVDGITTVSMSTFISVTGTLTTTDGGSTARRVQITSNSAGAQRTFTVGTNSLVNTDFKDIAAAGTASWVFGLGYGNLGGNTGITFDTSTLYWVGSTGNWSDGTKWSTSSGGSAANAVPAPQNSVIFDAASNTGTGSFTVTGNPAMFCNDFSTGGAGGALDGAMTLTLGATAALNVYGSMTLPASNFAFSNTTGSGLNFRANTTGKTFTTNGVSVLTVAIAFNGAGGEWTLGSALTSGNINVFEGSLVSGNYNITYGSLITSGSLTRSISLGSSTLTGSGSSPVSYTGSNLTWSAGTSTINSSNASPTLAGAGLTFYNVSFTSTAIGTVTIAGANTYNNLTFAARAAAGSGVVSIIDNQTINGTLTLGSGTTGVARLLVSSNLVGTPRTLTVATLAAPTDVDFRDITTAGASSPWSGTRLGNCRGNTNITFDAGKTVYWNLAAGGAYNAAAWATSSGGTAALTNFPLAQDTAIFENTGLNTSATVTLSAYNLGTIDMSTRSNAMTLANTTIQPRFYGNFILSSAVTLTGTGILNFNGQGVTQNITSAGVTFTQPIYIECPNGTFKLLDTFNSSNAAAYSSTSAAFRLTGGTLDINNQTINLAGSFGLPTTTTTRVVAFGSSGKIVSTGNNMIVFGYVGIDTTITGTSRFEAAYSGSTGTRTINFVSNTEGQLVNVYVTAGSDIFSLTVASTALYNLLDFTGFTGTVTTTSTAGANIYGDLILNSSLTFSPLGPFDFAKTSGTQQITSAGKVFSGVTFGEVTSTATYQLQDNLTTSSASTVTLTSGTLDLSSGNRTLSTGFFSSSNINTRSIAFGTGNITLTGNNSTSVNLSPVNYSYTGTPTFNLTYSGAIGLRYIAFGINGGATAANVADFNISAGSDILNIYTGGSATSVRSINFTGFTGNLDDSTRNIYGNLTLSSGMTTSAGTGNTNLQATSGTQQITTNGQVLDFPIVQNGTNSTVQLQDNLTMGSTRTYTLTNGTLDLNDFNLSTGAVASTNSNTRTIDFKSGSITLTGTALNIWNCSIANGLSILGTPTVNATYAGAASSRGIYHGATSGATETNSPSINVSAGTDSVIMQGLFLNVNFTGFAGTLTNIVRTIYGNFTLSSGITLTAGSAVTTFAATSGTKTITTALKTLDFPITQDGVGGTVQLQDALSIGATRALTVYNGTFDTNGQTITGPAAVTLATGTIGLKNTFTIPVTQSSGDVTLYANTATTTYTLTAGTLNLNGFNLTASTQFSTSNANVRSINFASYGKIILSGAGTVWDAATGTNLTTAGSGMISLTSASAKTFAGGGASYRTISQDGVGTLTLSGANTFDTIDNTVQPTTVTFPAGATTSVSNFMLSGTSGNLVTINSNSPGTRFTLAQI